MKKLVLATILASAIGLAQAQTVYGVLDVGVRADTKANSAGADKYAAVNGVQSTSRWGIKGTEDLGGGLAAKFQLEGGFNVSNGASSQQSSTGSVLFDRYSWVGLSSATLGEVQVGRNTNPSFDFAAQGITDPLRQALDGTANPAVTGSTATRINQVVTVVGATNSFKTTRADSMIKYLNKFGGVDVVAGYSAGGVAGDTQQKSSYSLGAKTTVAGITGAASTYQATDAADKKLKLYSVGATAPVGPVQLTAGYHTVKTDAGYAPANLTTTAAAATILGGVAGTEVKVATVGAKYQVTPKFSSTVAYNNGKYSNATQNGKLDSYIVWNQYDLSKRTNLYAEADYTRAQGDLTSSTLAKSQVGATVGIRHTF